MPIVNPNQTTTERPNLLPGVYPAKIISCELVKSKSGNDMLKWKFETQTGQWLYANTTFAGRGLDLFKRIIRASVNPNYETGEVNTDHCIGKVVSVTAEANPESKYLSVADVEAADFNAEADNSDLPF